MNENRLTAFVALILTPVVFFVLRFHQLFTTRPGFYICSTIDHRGLCPPEWQTMHGYVRQNLNDLVFNPFSGLFGPFGILNVVLLLILYAIVFFATSLIVTKFLAGRGK